jgi:hypothetical protein
LAAVRVPGARAGVDEELADVESRVLAWRRDLHRHPELSNRELRTAKLVGDHLRRLGLEVQTGIAHTGVAGFLKSGQPGPTIALRADMDALPVVERTGVPFRPTATANYLGDEVGRCRWPRAPARSWRSTISPDEEFRASRQAMFRLIGSWRMRFPVAA